MLALLLFQELFTSIIQKNHEFKPSLLPCKNISGVPVSKMCVNIEYQDIHPEIVFGIFRYFQIYFLDNRCIYTYESKRITLS
jgi:hypothetical protein